MFCYLNVFWPGNFEDEIRTGFGRGIVIKLRDLKDEKLYYMTAYLWLTSVTLIDETSGVEYEQPF